MPLINCEINLTFTWSEDCLLIYGDVDNQVPKFEITETKLYVPDVKLLHQLKLGFYRTINWNKYQSKASIQTQNKYLDYLIDQNSQG